MLVSNCCGAPVQNYSDELGLCAECKEHCDYESEEDFEEETPSLKNKIMKVTVQRTTDKVIEVDVNSCFKDYLVYYKILAGGVLTVTSKSVFIGELKCVERVMGYSKITETEFKDAFDKTMSNLSQIVSDTISELELQEG